MTTEMDSPFILLVDKKISSMKELIPVLEPVVQSGQGLLIIAEDIDGEALSTLVVNRIRGSLKIAAVKAPGFGEKRREMLDDLAALTGAVVVSEERGINLTDVNIDMLGNAEKIEITKDKTTIINGSGKPEEIRERVRQLRLSIETATSDYEKEKLQERLAKLAGGIAVLYIGAPTETEMKEKKDRVDDALAATRAAVEEGIVPGGGVALIRCASSLDAVKTVNDDEKLGVDIVRKALQAPLYQIVTNAGGNGNVVVHFVEQGVTSYGFNARTNEYGDMIEMGIIDPTKVTRTAIENAVSIASMVLMTECVIVDETKEDEMDMPHGMPGMM
jgi:chaperonin GroEL